MVEHAEQQREIQRLKQIFETHTESTQNSDRAGPFAQRAILDEKFINLQR